MKVNDTIHGFLIKQKQEVPEITGTFWEMEHRKTGAKLGWLQNEDENKTFSITFKTIPENDTGVFHILEHSVLQGSEKYPLKAPFVELMKGSLSTFLNAMTFADKTVYPVSSRNEKDFENLMRVYLDAVFHPMVYKNEKIFLQEGWHYESDSPNGEFNYNGVVLNEMRGASCSVDALLYQEMKAGLFPDNCYRYVSGGSPDAIVDLTYEEFLETHGKYYHPSNSYVVLDGNLNIEHTLSIIDEVLSDFEKRERDFPVPIQEGNEDQVLTRRYAVEKVEAHQGYLGLGFVVGRYDEIKKTIAARILADYLAGSNEAPLKKAILSGQYGYDVTVGFTDGLLQPYLLFTVRNMEPSQRSEVEALIRDTLLQVRQEGLDREQLEALLCQQEFVFRERDFGGYPSGIINAINVMESWLYGGDPVIMLSQSRYFDEIRQEIRDGSFEQYLERLILNNKHRVSVLMVPDESCLEEERKKEREKLTAFSASLKQQERERLWETQNALKAWQAAPNSEEETAVLPCLKLSDIGPKPAAVSHEVLEDGTIWHSSHTRGIHYLRLYFPMKGFSDSEISQAVFLSTVMGNLPLKDMPKSVLDMEKRRTFGMEMQYLEITSQPENNEGADVYFVVDVSFLEPKKQQAEELMKRILQDSLYSESEMIGEYLRQELEGCQQNMIRNGQQIALTQARSRCSKEGWYVNCASGPVYVEWLKQTLDQHEKDPAKLGRELANLAKQILVGKDMFVSVTAEGKPKECTESWKAVFPETGEMSVPVQKEEDAESTEKQIAGISIPAPISFAAMAANLNQAGIHNTGSWLVFSKIASMEYLWNEIRVLGGAYGTGMSVLLNGNVSFYSYRDPNPAASLQVFQGVCEFIEKFAEEKKNLDRLIIGTISSTEPLFTPYSMGKTADVWYLSGVSDELRKERRLQILNTSAEDLRMLAEQLKTLIPFMNCAVAADRETLKSMGEQVKIIC